MMLRLLPAFILLLCLALPVHAQSLSFERGGNWLVNPAAADIALHHDKADKLRLALYRLTDPKLLTQVMTARAARSLGEGELLRRVTDGSQPIWQGDMVTDPAQPLVRVPLDLLAGDPATNLLGSGVYVLTAAAGEARATQWFMRTSVDMATRFYGRHALVTLYDMATRQPRNASIQWLDASGKPVGAAVMTDANGSLWIDRPQDGNPVLLMAATPTTAGTENTELAFASVPPETAPTIARALILPDDDRVAGGQVLGGVVVAPGISPANLRATLGSQSLSLTPLSGAVYKFAAATPSNASIAALELRDGDQLLAHEQVQLTGNDNLKLDWQQKPSSLIGTSKAALKFRVLQNGKPIAAKTGVLTLTPVAAASTDSAPLSDSAPVALSFTTDAKGIASVTIDPAKLSFLSETAPSYVTLSVAIGDMPAGGRSALAFYPARNWLQLTPDFADNAVAEGATARFTVRPGSPDARNLPHVSGLEWQLSREAYKFEWYQAEDGRWTYRTKTALTPVVSGKAIFQDDAASIATQVGAGRYRLTVTDAVNHLSASVTFTAGWWLAPAPTLTPERIEMKAQMEKADDGKSRLAVFVDPPFAARVWLTVTTGNGASTVMQDVADEGSFMLIDQSDLPVGQPLTLNAFAIPSKPDATLAQAIGSLTLPAGLPLTVTPDAVSARQPTAITVTGVPSGQKVLLQVLDDDKLLFASGLLDVSGDLHATLPPLASDKALTLRVIATAPDGNSATLTDKRLTSDADIVLSVSSQTADLVSVTITAHHDVAEKLRLTLVGGESASANLAPLKADRSQTVRLPLKGEVKDLLLRLESVKGNKVLAALPLRLPAN